MTNGQRVSTTPVGRATSVVATRGTRAVGCTPHGRLQLWSLPKGRCVRETSVSLGLRRLALDALGEHVLLAHDDQLELLRVAEVGRAPWMVVRPRTSEEVLRDEQGFDEALEGARQALSRREARAATSWIATAAAVPGYQRSPQLAELRTSLATVTERGRPRAATLARTLTSLPTRRVCVTADRRLALAVGDNGQLTTWRLPTGQIEDRLHHDEQVRDVALDAAGRVAVSVTAGHEAHRWDLKADRSFSISAHRAAAERVAISADGRVALLLGREPWAVSLTSEAACQHTQHGYGLRAVALAADGTVALGGYANGVVRLWETATGAVRWQHRAHTSAVAAVALSPCARVGLSADHGPYQSAKQGTIRVWNAASGNPTGERAALATRLLVSFDGRTAAHTERDGPSCLWDLASGETTHTLEPAGDIALSGDARWALTAGPAGLRLWELGWEHRVHDPAEWDPRAAPFVDAFLRRQTPVLEDGLSRGGTPRWTDGDIERLMLELGWAGFGWLEREGVVMALRA